jgi:hypothetical protein
MVPYRAAKMAIANASEIMVALGKTSWSLRGIDETRPVICTRLVELISTTLWTVLICGALD